jgi:uncharacterized membrane protein YfcA
VTFALPLGLGPWEAGFVALCVLGAAWVRGYAGFGFSALVIGSAGLVVNPLALLPVVILSEGVMTGAQARVLREGVAWRRVGLMALGAAVAMQGSIGVLARLGEDAARLTVSGIVLAVCLSLLRGGGAARPAGTFGHVGAGVVSGVANGAGVGGLPIAAFLAAQGLDARTFRATLIAYFALLSLAALPALWRAGLLTGGTVAALAWLAPAMAAGLWLGGRSFSVARPEVFRRVTLTLLAGLAVAGIARSLF